jgi:hypothetical protein
MAITRATNLAAVGSGLGTSPAQPINVGTGVTIDGNSGIITANSFSGSGANLTGIAVTDDVSTNGLVVLGISTLAGATLSGVTTFQDHVHLGDNDKLKLGDSEIFEIFTTGTNSIIKENGSGNLKILGTNIIFKNNTDSKVYADFNNGGSVELYYDGSKKFETTGAGVTITGIATADFFYGDGSNLTNLPAAGITTEAGSASGIVTHVRLSSAQDHKITATGITTITSSGSGTEGESHTIRIVNSGIATVGFSTYFLFPSGSAPSLPTADGAISLISFTVHDSVGAGCTQLLAGASVNFS